GPCVRRRHCKRPHHRKCPKHSHWAPCGLSCPKTCAHPHGPLKCPLSCRPGCKCDKDYVRRNSDGTGPCIARTITKKDRKKDRKNTTKKVTKKIDFENRLIFLGLIVE
ncbi:hypothetical protein SSS_10529, partial [Sarcoptes scabiei]